MTMMMPITVVTVLMIIAIVFFKNFILIYLLNIQIQVSLIIGNLYSADLITGISSENNE